MELMVGLIFLTRVESLKAVTKTEEPNDRVM